MKQKLLFVFLLFVSFILKGQDKINIGINPSSWNSSNKDIITAIELAPLTQEYIESRIIESGKDGRAYQVASLIPINVDVNNSGSWITLENGNKVWRIQLSSYGAKAVNLHFNKLALREKTRLFVYTPDRKNVFGPYTNEDNLLRKEYSIGILRGNEVIVEYEVESNVNVTFTDFSINAFSYYFRGEDIYESTYNKEACEVNINCSEGTNWQLQKAGVAKIILVENGEEYLCSGSLVNNTSNDGTPYFLTANHCGDQATASDFNLWKFIFNYEYTSCASSGINTNLVQYVGCTKIAYGSVVTGSDFYLLKLSTLTVDKMISKGLILNGWDKSGTASTSGVSIHHPAGERKKISTYTSTLTPSNFNGSPSGSHWRVIWVATANGHGVTEGGSSGSPIFNSNGLIVGTLSGGSSYCTTPNAPDLYGKFSYHWSSNGTSTQRQLAPWLDPVNSGASTCSILDPIRIGINENAANTNSILVYPNPANSYFTISAEKSIEKIEIYNILGVTLVSKKVENNKVTVNCSDFAQGTYFVKITTNQTSMVKKIIVNR